ncbi:dipeptidase [Heliobacterium chlorum]|uniref:Dipeptidase n=1 Tax=Heliobacterium chlorum TaxID=2698 RepID=A0ABR7T6B8_HELCL|nr:dipeptidase [Heliobacterium chlorum]MBC9785772.1 dipeptidase [Heliobacterium chlorum]
MYPVVDAHCDTLSRLGKDQFDYSSGPGPITKETLVRGFVKVQFFAAYIDEAHKPYGSLRQALELIHHFHCLTEEHSKGLTKILWKEDLNTTEERIGALLTIEGAEALEGSLDVLHVLFRLGVRSIGLTWNQRNLLADGSWEEGSKSGLTRFGRQVVEAMQQMGMLVDLAHISPTGFWDVLEVSTKPVIVSHSNCRRIREHPRNLDDRQIRALAEQGGVMGINFCPDFLAAGMANLERVVEHIDHACQVAGTYDHVGIGSDFDGIEKTPRGLETAAAYPRLWDALSQKGYQKEQIKAIAGDNFLRLLTLQLPSRPDCPVSVP